MKTPLGLNKSLILNAQKNVSQNLTSTHIYQQFLKSLMPEIKLYKSSIKSLRLVFLTSSFVACGVFILLKTNNSKVMSILLILFFGAGLLIGLFNMLDIRPQIIIDKIGIWDRTMNQDRINWEFISEIISPIDISRQIFIPLVVDEKFVRRKKMFKWALDLSKAFGGRDINLNISYIKIDKEKFITLLDILKNEEIENRDEVIEMYKDRIIE